MNEMWNEIILFRVREEIINLPEYRKHFQYFRICIHDGNIFIECVTLNFEQIIWTEPKISFINILVPVVTHHCTNLWKHKIIVMTLSNSFSEDFQLDIFILKELKWNSVSIHPDICSQLRTNILEIYYLFLYPEAT